MYKQILAHRKYINNKLETELSSESREKLFNYHLARVQDFQHERLIHLLVTFFFAELLLATILVYLSLTYLLWPLIALIVILFVLELFYIRHYYQLENGVQSLYELTIKLGQ